MLNKAVYLELLGTEWNWLELIGKRSFDTYFDTCLQRFDT